MASQSVLEDLREAFNLFDINKDGQIDARELRKVLKCLSFPETEEECKKIIKSLDTDRNGQLSFDELCGIFEVRMARVDKDEIFKIHKRLADPKSGNITKESLKEHMGRLGFSNVTDKLIDDMIREISVAGMSTDDDDDSVSPEEFLNLMQHKGMDLSEIELGPQ